MKKTRTNKGKAASIYDVARESGVSVFTVSEVVNKKSHVSKKLRDRVEKTIRKLNYRPNLIARSLAKQKTHTIGMIVPDIANPFFPMVVRGAEDAAQKHGYNLLLCNSDGVHVLSGTEEELMRKPNRFVVGGTISLWTRIHISEIKRLFAPPA